MNLMARLGCIVALLSAPGFCPALQPAHEPIPGLPFVVGTLDSSQLDLREPRVFITRSEIDRANRRAATEPLLREIRARVVAEADEHLETPVAPIDERWWDRARDKPWSDTYPEVYLNTMAIPSRSSKPAAELALAYLLTGDERYADKATAFLLNLAPYSFEPVHYDVGLNYAIWCLHTMRAYEILAPRMTADERSQIDRFMERAAVAVAKNDIYWIEHGIGGGINNHLAWHKLWLGLVGLFYDRPEMVEFCLNGPRGLIPLLTDGLLDNGLWLESSLTYQFTAIAPMMVLAECQQRLAGTPGSHAHPGIHEIVAANGRTLQQSYDAMFQVLAPDLLIPPIGDAYARRDKLSHNSLYEQCWKLWGEPRYAWLVQQNPRPSASLLFAPPLPAEDPPAPPIASTLLPEHGYVFLRSHRDQQYWHNRDARCAFLTYDRSSVHANADKLSLMLFGLNRMLVSDVEGKATVPHAFSSRIQAELNRGGLSQNTVMIDGLDQRCSSEMLDLVEYRDLPDEKRVTAVDRRGILYPGVRQMRSVAMTPEYVLDVFQVDVGAEPRQIDWIAHIMDENASTPDELNPLLTRAEPFALPDVAAYRYLRDPRAVTLVPNDEADRNHLLAFEWRDGPDRLGLRMMRRKLDRLIVCGYPATDEPGSGNIPMLIARVQATQARFVAIWLVGDAPADVEIEQLPDHEGRLVFKVSAAGKTREHQIPLL
jgi:hypothetical protein